VSVNVCLKAYSKTGPHIHLVQEYSGAHASAARPPGGRSTALHDLYWATGCAVSMSNTRGVAVCDTHVTRTPRVLVTSNIIHLGCWVCRRRRGPARSRTNLTKKPLQSTPTPSRSRLRRRGFSTFSPQPIGASVLRSSQKFSRAACRVDPSHPRRSPPFVGQASPEWLSILRLNPTCVPPHVIAIRLAASPNQSRRPRSS